MSSLDAAAVESADPDAVALWSPREKPAEYADDAAATDKVTRLTLNIVDEHLEEIVMSHSILIFIFVIIRRSIPALSKTSSL
jgi:hypothetical protein